MPKLGHHFLFRLASPQYFPSASGRHIAKVLLHLIQGILLSKKTYLQFQNPNRKHSQFPPFFISNSGSFSLACEDLSLAGTTRAQRKHFQPRLLLVNNHNTTTMNGPLFPPGGGGMDGADAQTMAAVRSVRSLHLSSAEE